MTALDLLHDPAYRAFWTARHLCTVTTSRPDGSLHVTPMGIVLDVDAAQAWGITFGHSVKVRNLTTGPQPRWVAIGQLAGPHWASLEGTATIHDDPATVAEAERRYATRYRQPRPNPARVALLVDLTRALGRAPEL